MVYRGVKKMNRPNCLSARMEAAGFDELLADVQDQINEWFASGH